MNPLSCASIFTYYVGDSKTLTFKALFQNNLSPLDLTDCEEIAVNLPNADGTSTQLLLSEDQVIVATPTNLGQASATITATLWPNPNVGELQSLDVTYTISGLVTTVRFPAMLTVRQP